MAARHFSSAPKYILRVALKRDGHAVSNGENMPVNDDQILSHRHRRADFRREERRAGLVPAFTLVEASLPPEPTPFVPAASFLEATFAPAEPVPLAGAFFALDRTVPDVVLLEVTFLAANEPALRPLLLAEAFATILPPRKERATRFGPSTRCERALAGTPISKAIASCESFAVFDLCAAEPGDTLV